MLSKKTYQYRKANRLCTDCGKENDIPGNRCTPCREKVRTGASKIYRKKRNVGECAQCNQQATIGVLCEKHWFCHISKAHFGHIKNAKLLKDLLEKQAYRCPITGRLLTPGVNTSIDHIVPRSKGGSNDFNNLQWVDYNANVAKAELSLDELIKLSNEIITHASRNNIFNK